jgi:hypothetical protein
LFGCDELPVQVQIPEPEPIPEPVKEETKPKQWVVKDKEQYLKLAKAWDKFQATDFRSKEAKGEFWFLADEIIHFGESRVNEPDFRGTSIVFTESL